MDDKADHFIRLRDVQVLTKCFIVLKWEAKPSPEDYKGERETEIPQTQVEKQLMSLN